MDKDTITRGILRGLKGAHGAGLKVDYANWGPLHQVMLNAAVKAGVQMEAAGSENVPAFFPAPVFVATSVDGEEINTTVTVREVQVTAARVAWHILPLLTEEAFSQHVSHAREARYLPVAGP